MGPCNPCVNDRYRIEISNPYYWHGRPDFNGLAELPQPGSGSGEFGLTDAGIHEGFTSFAHPLANSEGAPPRVSSDRFALTPSSGDEISLGDSLDTFQIGSLSPDGDIFSTDDGAIGTGEILFASSEDGAITTGENLFASTGGPSEENFLGVLPSGADSNNIFTNNNGIIGSGETFLASTDGDLDSTLPTDLFTT